VKALRSHDFGLKFFCGEWSSRGAFDFDPPRHARLRLSHRSFFDTLFLTIIRQIPSNCSIIKSIIKTGGMISLLIFSMDARLRVLSLAVSTKSANDACRFLQVELDDWSLLKSGLCTVTRRGLLWRSEDLATSIPAAKFFLSLL
jgi:hypothetical protein